MRLKVTHIEEDDLMSLLGLLMQASSTLSSVEQKAAALQQLITRAVQECMVMEEKEV
jgi:hypothetical protein